MELARWITHSDNPLSGEVSSIVYGNIISAATIVDTPNDFGRMGSLPSHPELLDWLSQRIEEQWRFPKTHSSLDRHQRCLPKKLYIASRGFIH
jgi:hypothetical protein